MVRCRIVLRLGSTAAWSLCAVLLASSAGCAPGPPSGNLEQQLLDADRAFLQATIEDGLEGWLSFFTEDAVRVDIHGGWFMGLDAIREADAPLFEPGGLRLRWEPQEATAFATGREGMTWGSYTLVRPAGEGGEQEIVDSGHYVTLWRWEDGRFKVFMDTGAPDPEPDDSGLIAE